MRNEQTKKQGKAWKIVVAVIVAILLMVGISFVVANAVHKDGAQSASSSVKNGLSAYELAAQQGYDGTLNDWIKSLNGKSAYEIAKENGYKGSEEEWAKALSSNANQDTAAIKTAEFNSNGELVLTLSDGSQINAGKVAGTDGKNGKNGKDGKNGQDGEDGTNGANGVNGKDGANGINGVNGKDGMNGTNGVDGVGISNIVVTPDGKLNITLSNATTLNLGTIKGADGAKGEKGEKGDTGVQGIQGEKGEKGDTGAQGVAGKDGKDGVNGADGAKGDKGDTGAQGVQGEKGDKGDAGRGIAKTEIVNGELIITYTDGTQDNLGGITSDYADIGYLKFTKVASTNSYKVEIKDEYRSTIRSITIPSRYNGLPVTEIGENAFENCNALQKISIPESITTIGPSAFDCCYMLNNVYLPNTITSIGKEAFFRCMSLENIIIPSSVVSIEDDTFAYCNSLKDVALSDGLKKIGKGVFYDCTLLNNITLPDNLETIEARAFQGCVALEELNIPKSVTVLGERFVDFIDYKTNVKVNFEDTSGWQKRYVFVIPGESYYGEWENVDSSIMADNEAFKTLMKTTYNNNGKSYNYEFQKV